MQQSAGDFNLSKVWDRSIELVMSNWQLLAIIAGVFMLLPTLAMYVAVPELSDMGAMAQPDPDASPEEVFAELGDLYAGIAPYALVSTVLSFIGYSAMVALMGETGVTVGETIKRGAKSVLTLIAVTVLFFLAYMLGAILIFIPVALLGLVGEALAAIGGILGAVAVIAMMLFLIGRFSVTMPVIVLEKDLNPVTAMVKSWKLTAPKKWALMGFWSLLLIAYTVIALIVTSAVGVIAALASGTASALIMGIFTGLLGVIVAMIVSGIAVALYQSLSGQTAESVSETFE